MVTPQLIDFIKSQRNLGKNDEQLKQILINSGWKIEDVQLGLSQTTTSPNSVSYSPQQPISPAKSTNSVWEYVIYFFLGTILSLIGLLIGGLWILIKGNQNKLRKFIVLVVGTILSIAILFVLTGGVTVSTSTANPISIVGSATPAMQSVEEGLKSYATDKRIVLSYTKYTRPVTVGNTSFSSVIDTKIYSNKTVSASEVSDIGKQICVTLQQIGASVDSVQVGVTVTKYLFMSSTKGGGGTCEEWNSGKMYNDLSKYFN